MTLSVLNGHLPVAQFLLEHGAQPERALSFIALINLDHETSRWLQGRQTALTEHRHLIQASNHLFAKTESDRRRL